MSKLVIATQFRENYGAHDWDGVGTCPQYWKNKGGSVYVVENLSTSMINKISNTGIPTLSSLIEQSDDYSSVHIIDWEIVNDDKVVCDDWEAPIILSYDRTAEAWRANVITERESSMGEFDAISETWIMEKEGARDYDNYRKLYRTLEGEWVEDHVILERRKA